MTEAQAAEMLTKLDAIFVAVSIGSSILHHVAGFAFCFVGLYLCGFSFRGSPLGHQGA